jgi:hypothetical protein
MAVCLQPRSWQPMPFAKTVKPCGHVSWLADVRQLLWSIFETAAISVSEHEADELNCQNP